jgi:hypothetical protein
VEGAVTTSSSEGRQRPPESVRRAGDDQAMVRARR